MAQHKYEVILVSGEPIRLAEAVVLVCASSEKEARKLAKDLVFKGEVSWEGEPDGLCPDIISVEDLGEDEGQ